MPAVDTQGAKVKRGKRVKHPKGTTPTPDQQDRNRQPRTPPPPVKVRAYAHPQRKEPQKVIRAEVKRQQREHADRAAVKATVRKIHVTPVPSPDATDSTRSTAQRTRDAAVVAANVRESREKYVREQRRGSGTRAVVTFAKGGPDPTGPVHYTAAAQKTRKQGIARRAAVLDVLEETTRPLHGVAAAAKANVHAIKTEGLKPRPLYLQAPPKKTLEAAAKGVKNEDKTTFSDVLTEAGWKPKSGAGKFAKGAVGLTLDVGLDPTTYVTGGTGSIAGKGAARAAARTAEKTAAGRAEARVPTTAKEARRARERAAGGGASAPSLSTRAHARVARSGDQTKGVVLRVAGAEVPGVRKATAHASKPVRRAARKVTPNRVREGARAVGADLNPNVAPVGVARETSDAAIRATRTARSKSNRGTHEAQQVALGIKKQVGEANYSRIIDAIENGTIKSLPGELRGAAIRVRSEFRHANRQRKHAGISSAEVGGKKAKGRVKEYIPHHLTDEGHETLGHTADQAAHKGRPGRKVIRPASSMGRADERKGPLSELRVKFPGQYSEDLPSVFAAHKVEHATAVARAGLNRRLADLGTTVKRGSHVATEPGEGVYHITGSNISPKLTDEQVQKVVDNGTHLSGEKAKGRYVVLNDELVKRTLEGVQPHPSEGIVRALDKTQAGFKKIALATPGFHVRNLIGDTQNAYLYQPGHRLPKNLAQAGGVLKAEGRSDKALRNLAQPAKGKGTVKTARYGDVTYDDVAKHLTEHGGMRSGYTAREIPELAHQGAKGPRLRVPRKLRQAALNREDLPRVSTALEALRRGATWEEAAHAVSTYHFDYAHLTSFERNIARRAAPFYTFTARNVPLQAKSLVTKPGKYANYQKVREEASKLVQPDQQDPKTRDLYKQLERAGVKLPGGWEKYLSEYEQRNAGVPISWKGQKYTVSLGLPLSDLNELPGFAGGPAGQAREFFNKAASMVTPIVKDPTEIGLNYSFFFRDQVERDDSPLVNAPSFVSKFPDSAKRKLGIVRGQDKRSGEKVWKWPGKVDYIAHTPPGLINAALKLATPGADRQNRGVGGKALQVAGVRAQPIDATSNVVNLAYARGREIEKRQAKLRQTANPANGLLISAKNPTPEYTRLSQQLKVTKQIEYQGKSKRGDAVLPPQGGPPKGRSSGSRIKLGGGSTGRVKLGGSSTGRVRLGGG